MMHYDVAIIGAGLSGLAAGIRLAYFDYNVCILERHYAYGGLNSYYTQDGRAFDVGLHALTNFVPPGIRNAPLPKLLRQLRISRDELDLREQNYSEVRFPERRLRFTNDFEVLRSEVARVFPGDIDRFDKLTETIKSYDDMRFDVPYQSTRDILRERLSEPVLAEMLLCPLMYYGCANEHDMDFTQFVILFKSIFCEGFAKPAGGVRPLLKTLVKKFRSCGGKLRMRCGVQSIEVDGRRAAALTLDGGESITCDKVFSCAGHYETMGLCSDVTEPPPASDVGQISFVESFAVLDRPTADLGCDSTIVFFNDADTFTYARPDPAVDLRSGVVCCSENYDLPEPPDEGLIRLTWLANHARWLDLEENDYQAQKRKYHDPMLERLTQFVPDIASHLVCTDMFTPRTIRKYTGHLNGNVYGSPTKLRDGRTRLENLFICGTDQGFLGIIGAMLSGISMANLHVLSES